MFLGDEHILWASLFLGLSRNQHEQLSIVTSHSSPSTPGKDRGKRGKGRWRGRERGKESTMRLCSTLSMRDMGWTFHCPELTRLEL